MKILRGNLVQCLIVTFIVCRASTVSAQLGGVGVYKFLWNPPDAHIAALAGNGIAIRDDDAALAMQNPSLLNENSNNKLSFNHRFFYSGLQDGTFTYAFSPKSIPYHFHAGVQYANYGNFTQADEYGNITGSFKAADYALIVGASRNLYENLSLGVNLKFITSQLESYKSTGLAADIGASYFIPNKNFTIALVCRNIGTQLTDYNDKPERLPYELQAGISKRLAHLPFRFSIVYTNLQRWNVLYDDPEQVKENDIFTNQNAQRSDASIFIDNLFRHFVFNGEFLIGKKENLRLRIGYNHLLRKELSVNNYRSLAGFSGGLGFKISKFRFDYGMTIYHLTGKAHHLSLSTDIDSFRKGH